MSFISYDRIHKVNAWQDANLQLLLVQNEGLSGEADTDSCYKTLKFQLFDGRGIISSALSSATIQLAIIRSDGTEALYNAETLTQSDIDNGIVTFVVTPNLTSVPGLIHGEIRVTSTNAVIKFYGVSFYVRNGVSNEAITQTSVFPETLSDKFPIDTIDIADGAVTEAKLSSDLQGAINGKEDLENKAQSLASESTTQYPSVKAVSDALTELASQCESKSNIVTSLSPASTNTQYPSAKCVYDAIASASGGQNIFTVNLTLSLDYETDEWVLSLPTGITLETLYRAIWNAATAGKYVRLLVARREPRGTIPSTLFIPLVEVYYDNDDVNREFIFKGWYFDELTDIEIHISQTELWCEPT